MGRGGDERRARTQGQRTGHSARRVERRHRGGGPAGAWRPCTAAAPPSAALSSSISAAGSQLPASTTATRPRHGSSDRRWMGGRRDSADDGTRRLGISFAICAPARSPGTPPAASPAPAPPSQLSPGANGPAACSLPLADRSTGCRRGLRASRAAAAPSCARRNARQQQGGRQPSRADSAAVDLDPIGRFDRRRQPFLARLTAGGGCVQPDRSGR